MTISHAPTEEALARDVRVTSKDLIVELRDGRTISVPLEWYPRLAHGSPRQRREWELIGPGLGIHWPALDEDISIKGLLEGVPSGEGVKSFTRWLESRGRVERRARDGEPAVVREPRAGYRAKLKRR